MTTPEQAIIYLCLHESGMLAFCRQRGIDERTFADPRNGLIFREACELEARGIGVDPVNLYAETTANGTIGAIGGHTYLHQVAEWFSVQAHAEHYIERMRETHARRTLSAIGRRLAESMGESMDKPTTEIIAEVSEQLGALSGTRSTVRPYADEVDAQIERMERAIAGEAPPMGPLTGLPCLDAALQGLQPGKLVVLAARPSAGKTSLEGQIARHVSLVECRGVYRITRDTSIDSLARRDLVGENVGLTMSKANRGEITPEQLERAKSTARAIRVAMMIVDDQTRALEDMVLAIRMARARHRIELVTVDYAQIVEVANGKGLRDDERLTIRRVSNTFKALAKELGICILLLAQLSRSAEADTTKAPTMKDLLGSGALEQDADAILMLYRSVSYSYDAPTMEALDNGIGGYVMEPDGKGGERIVLDRTKSRWVTFADPVRPITLDLVKHKDGPLGRWPLWFDAGYFRFREALPNHGQVA